MTNLVVPGPHTSILDDYHYRKLAQHPQCDKKQLRELWRQWLKLGEYKNGESQRNNLFSACAEWGKHHESYAEIQKGLHGSLEEREEFEARWTASAKSEAAEFPDWKMWTAVEDLREGAPTPCREPRCLLHDRLTPDNFLGDRIYQ